MALRRSHFAKLCFACLPHGPSFGVRPGRQVPPYRKKKKPPEGGFWDGAKTQGRAGAWLKGKSDSARSVLATSVGKTVRFAFRAAGIKKKKPPEGGL